MKVKQTVILILAMVVPIGVFIFLKVFGNNQFAVEPLHQTGVISPVASECGIKYEAPYYVPKNVLEDLGWTSADSLTLYIFDSESFDLEAINNRISEEYTVNEILRYVVTDSTKAGIDVSGLNILPKDAVTVEQLQECFFLMEAKTNSVLVDSKRRIRGNYNLKGREDADRLLLELKIILKKYKHD